MQALKVKHEKVVPVTNWKPLDWISHASFGLGQVSESRGDKLDIDFVNGGRKTLLRSTQLNRAVAPGMRFKLPRDKSKTRLVLVKARKTPGEFAE